MIQDVPMPASSPSLAGLGALLVSAFPGLAFGQAASAAAMRETMNIGDEPGRVSTEEVIIATVPTARQLVFFRSTEAPGTLVIHTSQRFLYVVLGNNKALRYGIGVGREGFSGRASSRSPARPNGRTGRRRRK
jgi:lipoprotein-anchoring transpeptidase ErfK/SrfK